MARNHTLSVRVSPEMLHQLDLIAASTRRTKSFLGSEALERFIKTESEIIAGIQEGGEDIAKGRVVPHAEAMKRIRGVIARVEAEQKVA
jgi:predicted transcriptional regulator